MSEPGPETDSELNDLIRALPGPILVVGASGFVGANLLRRILSVRRDVTGTTLHNHAWRLTEVPAAHIAFLDLLDSTSVEDIFARLTPRTVFHCAAYGAYAFQTDADRIYRTNLGALNGMLDAASRHRVHAFIHAGSSSEYGLNCAGPDEAAERQPNSHYAISKSAASDLIAFRGQVAKLPVCNLRLYSVYGPYEDSSRLIPNLVRHGLEHRLPPFVAPETTRDFVHVDDVLAAFVTAAVRMSPQIAGQSFNIATGRRMSMQQIAAVASVQFGVSDPPRFNGMEPRPWDLPDWFGVPTKAANLLGWRAKIPFELGLERTTAWWRDILQQRSFEELSERNRERKSRNSVSAVIACYKDADAIPIMYRRLTDTFRSLGVDYEIIFVNDCSPDDTAQVIQDLSAQDPHVLGVSHSRNFGSQAAFRSGMELAKREACVLLDGDLQDPPELISEFVTKWREGYDVVYGRRIRREMPWLQERLYKAFYALFSSLSNVPIPRDAGDFSLIDRRAISWILRCQERDSFLRGLRAFVGFRQIGVDYVRPERMFGRSTNNFLRNVGWAKKAIFSFTNTPLDAMFLLGVSLFVLAVFGMLILLLVKTVAPHLAPPGISSVMLTTVFFGSINLLGLSLIGEYVGKILEEVKHRPPFIRTAIISDGRVHEPSVFCSPPPENTP